MENVVYFHYYSLSKQTTTVSIVFWFIYCFIYRVFVFPKINPFYWLCKSFCLTVFGFRKISTMTRWILYNQNLWFSKLWWETFEIPVLIRQTINYYLNNLNEFKLIINSNLNIDNFCLWIFCSWYCASSRTWRMITYQITSCWQAQLWPTKYHSISG